MLNLEKVVAFYGNDANEEAIKQQMRRLRTMAEQMKLSSKTDGPKEVHKAGSVGNKSVTGFQPKGKSSKSRASTKKSDHALSGRVKRPTRRTIGKPAPTVIDTAAMEIAGSKEDKEAVIEEEDLIKEEDLVPYIPVVMNDTYEDSENGKILYEWNWVE